MNKIKLLYKNIKKVIALSYKWMPFYTVILFVINIGIYMVPIVQAKVTGSIVTSLTNSVSQHSGFEAIFILIATYVVVRLFADLFSSLNFFFDKRWTNRFANHQEIFEMEAYGRLEPGQLEDPKIKSLVSTVKYKGFWSMMGLAELQFTSFGIIAVFVTTSLIIFKINPFIILILVISSSFEFYLQLRYNQRSWNIWHEDSDRMKMFAHLKEHATAKTSAIQNRLLQAVKYITDKAQNILDLFNKDQEKLDRDKVTRSLAAHFCASIGFGLSFYLIINDVLAGKIDVGQMVFYLSILGQYVSNIDQFFSNLSRQYKLVLEVDDIFKLAELTPFVSENEHPVKLNLHKAPVIEFKNVHFTYPGQTTPIFQDFNLKINSGEKIALVGNNGAGKTTFVRLLCRFYDPQKGDIFINGINIKDISRDEWYGYLALLFQDYSPYSFKAKESIAMGRSENELDFDKVKDSATHSGADEFISDWKDSYEQQLGSDFGGTSPSQGQEQKIAIARSLYRGGYVLVLDEPTASVDALSEADIFEKIRVSTENRTLILISHRFNTVINMDRIIVVEQGKVVEEGTHAELLKKKRGVYTKMFNSQASGYVSA
ncbi:MAG: ABC transporter ATP-binding protein [bacterium]